MPLAGGEDAGDTFPAQLLDRFTPHECRGRGTEGSVWRCTRVGDGAEVAVKVHWAGRPMDANLLEHLRAPGFRRHVPEIHDNGTLVTPHGEIAWVAMEYFETTFAELVDGNGVAPDRAKELLAELAAALDFWQRVVGRNPLDFKPDNLMVRQGEHEQIVIADFGGVSAFTASQQQGGTFMAAVAYSPPEEVWQEKRSPWPWWSLGEIAYLLVTGHTRFQRPDGGFLPDAVIRRIRHVGDLELDTVPDPRWQLLIQGLLTRDPYDRWTYDEVSAWLRGENPPVVAAAVRLQPNTHRPITFVDGRTFVDPGDLAAAMLDDWRAAEEWLSSTGRQELLDWLTKEDLDRRFDTSHLRGLTGDNSRAHRAILAFGAAFAPTVTPKVRGRVVDADGLVALLGTGDRGFAEAGGLIKARMLGLAAGYRCGHAQCAGDRCAVLARAEADLTGLVDDVEAMIATTGAGANADGWTALSEGERDRVNGLALLAVLRPDLMPGSVRRPAHELVGTPRWWRDLYTRVRTADPRTHAGRVVLVTAGVLWERAFAERVTTLDGARGRLGLGATRIARAVACCALTFAGLVLVAWLVGAFGLSALAFQEDPVASARALAEEPAFFRRLAPALLVLAVDVVVLARGRGAWIVGAVVLTAALAVVAPRLPGFTAVELPGPVEDLVGTLHGAWQDNLTLGAVIMGAVALGCLIGAARLLPGRAQRPAGPWLATAPAGTRRLIAFGLFALLLPAALWAAAVLRLTVTDGSATTSWIGQRAAGEQSAYLLVLLLAAAIAAIGWQHTKPVLVIALLAAVALGLWAQPVPGIDEIRYPVATDLLTGIAGLWDGGAFWLALLVHVPLCVATYRSALRLPGR
ncbi:hypothetical protein JCM33774_24010 [Actinophytocola sp. KF-1]